MRSILRPTAALAVITAESFVFSRLIVVNLTTVGFLYLITILVIATEWGLLEAVLASVAATMGYNFFFFPPIGTFSIADPLNWVALSTFLVTSLITSQLSERAKRRTSEVLSRQLEMERLYALSRAIMLADPDHPLAMHLAREIARIYEIPSVAIYDRSSGQMFHAGLEEFSNLERQIQDAAVRGTQFRDDTTLTIVSAISFGGQPVGSIALKGASVSDMVLQGISNLVSLGLERARGQDAANRANAARQSEEFKSTLLDALTHEFKTPLTSIKAATSAILSSAISRPEELREMLTMIDQDANRLSGLVTEAIHLARVEPGKMQLNKQPIPPRGIVDATLGQMNSALEGRHIELSVPDDLPPVPVDMELMQLVLRHLVDNAVKYSPASSPISITARLSDDAVVISVRNEGEGIPEWELSKIFEKFYRGSTVRHQVPGTGMGLSIAREIVLAHGGNVRVESSPGQGAEFMLSLPLARKEILT